MQSHLIKGDFAGEGVWCGAQVKTYHAFHALHAARSLAHQILGVAICRKAAAVAEQGVGVTLVRAACGLQLPNATGD